MDPYPGLAQPGRVAVEVSAQAALSPIMSLVEKCQLKACAASFGTAQGQGFESPRLCRVRVPPEISDPDGTQSPNQARCTYSRTRLSGLNRLRACTKVSDSSTINTERFASSTGFSLAVLLPPATRTCAAQAVIVSAARG
ncbi:MAG: hypothetical protein QOE61_2134 [Micromonosporaceae bacterium]|nr:hypothetical protein [Micromonosporaceae bacterium]